MSKVSAQSTSGLREALEEVDIGERDREDEEGPGETEGRDEAPSWMLNELLLSSVVSLPLKYKQIQKRFLGTYTFQINLISFYGWLHHTYILPSMLPQLSVLE